MNMKVIVAAAVGGFVSAVLVDLHAWRDGIGQFNWKKAIGRWIGGAVAGAISVIGGSAAV